MKKITIILLFLSFLPFCRTTAQREKPEYMDSFKAKLAETQLLIRQVVPQNFRLVPKDPDIPYHYDYALYSEEAGIEIRYIVKSIPALHREMAEIKKKEPSTVFAKPKKDEHIIHYAVFLMNLGGEGPASSYSKFPDKAVKDEFGADWGSSVAFEMRPGTDKKYRYCNLVALHRDNLADVYILYLSDSPDKLIEFTKKTYLFYNLRFM